MQPLDELSSKKACKSCWNCNVLLNVFGSDILLLQPHCLPAGVLVCSAHLIQLWLGSDQSSFQLHWALELKKKGKLKV